ncbi:hypothetical protein BDY24DRAFT_437432 [Mrakia frigida]
MILSSTGESVTSSRGLMTCSRCKANRYCSTYHQRKDWPNHKRFCFEAKW